MNRKMKISIMAVAFSCIWLLAAIPAAGDDIGSPSSSVRDGIPSILASSNMQQETTKKNQALVIPMTECVECPPDATPEDEPDCHDDYEDHTNGGCGSTPPVFGDVSCGETICGESGTFLYDGAQARDTDWFDFYLTDDREVTITAMAEFDVMVFILEIGPGWCDDFEILYYEFIPACEEFSFTVDLAAGDYWIWVAPEAFEGVPCGSLYYFTVTCGEQNEVPTLSEWGMLILGLLLLAAGTVAVVRRRSRRYA